MSENRTIGPYAFKRLLGKGGMSEVYEVEDVRLGSLHALKLFSYEKEDADVRDRFLVEGKLLSRLAHPRIVKVTDVGTDEVSGRPYFVMDLVRNERGDVQLLSDVAPGTVDEETVGKWYDDLREGLAYIHANGVIHRDLKLQNVLIGPDGHAVLMDFGISKIFDAKGDGAKIVDTVNTIVKIREGRSLVMGSVGYMAPELEMGVAASPQSDWYALGVCVYRLLTGTWCDARTDVVGMLETFDPVWKRIVPRLLHANPSGRECLSYAEERQNDQERLAFELEERWLKEKTRGRFARHAARWLAGALVVLSVTFAILAVRWQAEIRTNRAERLLSGVGGSGLGFDEIFRIPSDAQAEEQTNEKGDMTVPSREDLSAARIDLMVITHSLFARLNRGELTVEAVVAELERLRDGFASDADTAYDQWPEGYMQVGDDETIYWMLERALVLIREWTER